MKRIDSPSNPRIKAVRRLVQKHDYKELWIVEGRNLFLDALASGVSFREVFVTPAILQQVNRSFGALQDSTAVYEVSSRLMESMTSLDTPPGVLGIAVPLSIPEPPVPKGFAAFLISVRDPGNLGALARSAEAAGCEFLACSADCADPYQPKALRASMGSLFRVPAFKVPEINVYLRETRARGIHVYALQQRGSDNLYSLKPSFPALIVAGGEASGLPAGLDADIQVSIPMKGRVNSLNVAAAGTLCFYHFLKEQG